MTTVADVISECRNDYLLTGAREQRNRLANAYDADDTSFVFTYDLRGIDVGAKLSLGLEDLYVQDVAQASRTAVVSRGEFGSTAATHASGDTVLVNPRYTDAQILRAVDNELRSLSANGLFQVTHKDFPYNAAIEGYDLAAGVLSVIDVHYQAIGPSLDWPTVPRSLWDHQRMDATSEFASGQALMIRDALDPGRTVRVKYKAAFTLLTALAQDVTAISGLPATATDILALGAAIRLTAGGEVRRNQTEAQPDTRLRQDVPAGAKLGANRDLKQQHAQRVAEERSRLALMYPARW